MYHKGHFINTNCNHYVDWMNKCTFQHVNKTYIECKYLKHEIVLNLNSTKSCKFFCFVMIN